MAVEKYRYPMEFPYTEEVFNIYEEECICFAQWIGPTNVIFGNRHRLFIRDTHFSQTFEDPLEECKHSRNINCMRSNPSQTRLAVGIGRSVIVYDIPSLKHNDQIHSEVIAEMVEEVCWIDNDTFAIVNNLGEIVIIEYNEIFVELRRRTIVPRYETLETDSFKYNIFEYHSGFKEFVYLSPVFPTLYVIKPDLISRPRTKNLGYRLNMNYFNKPLMIGVHSSCPRYFIANYRTILGLDPENLQNVAVCRQWKGCYTLSVADNVITFSTDWLTNAVHFMDFQNQQDSNYSLESQVSIELPRSRFLRRRQPEIVKPRIYVHCYNEDRTIIFCGGTLRSETSRESSHVAIWRVNFPEIQQTIAPESPKLKRFDTSESHAGPFEPNE